MTNAKNTITLKKLRHTALLARIKLTPAEEKKFLPQLGSILAYFKILTRVDTSRAPPSFQAVSQKSVTRPDIISSGLSQKQALASAPASQNGYFKVKASIEK